MTIQEELEAIREQNDGLLRAEDVLEFAKNPDTSLHKKFTWDDGEAAARYRLWEARLVIRVHVFTPERAQSSVRTYVSLMSDRHQPGGGYRHLGDVMADVEQRKQLLAQAMREAKLWREKYKTLQELAPIFGAIDEVAQVPLLPSPQPDALELAA